MSFYKRMFDDNIQLVLRIAVFGTFLGHGYFALVGAENFVRLLRSMAPVDTATAVDLLFVIGIIDWVIAFWTLLKPNKYVLIYATVWPFLAALSRITAGDPIMDFVIRVANWGVPLALLLYLERRKIADRIQGGLRDKIQLVLRIGTFCTFFGYGSFALIGYENFVRLLQSMVPVDTQTAVGLLFIIGLMDWAIAFWALLKPNRYVLIYASVWAFISTLSWITAGDHVMQTVERAALWGVSLALLLYLEKTRRFNLPQKESALRSPDRLWSTNYDWAKKNEPKSLQSFF